MTSYPGMIRRFRANEDGAAIVEFTIAMPLFLFVFFGLLDFGRLAFHYVTAERAMHVAARVAAVRPPACNGVPLINARGLISQSTLPPDFGTACSAASDVCAAAVAVTCVGNSANATASEIWTLIQGAMPNDATIANLSFNYDYDRNLGFLGGPYVPVVTVEVQNLNFQFLSPLSAIVGISGAAVAPGLGSDIPFPPMSVSLPAEDLALGTDG